MKFEKGSKYHGLDIVLDPSMRSKLWGGAWTPLMAIMNGQDARNHGQATY